MKLATLRRLLLSVIIAVPVAADAQLAQSHFDAGLDGWKLGDLFVNDGYDGYLHWNAGGYVTTDDWFGNNGFVAPAAYIGNKSAAFGHNLTFKIKSYYESAYSALPYVVISDGTTRLQFEAPVTAQNVWANMVVPFTAAAGWEVETDGSFNHQTAATDEQLLQVLSNLEYLHIVADFHIGSDLVYLDDVVMEGSLDDPTATPEPSSIVLLATGLAGIGAIVRKRKNRQQM